jgi:hypothetical protein
MTNTYRVYTALRYSWWWTVDLSETCRVLYQINVRNSASSWLSLLENIAMHFPLNVKNDKTYFIVHLLVCYIRVNIPQCMNMEIIITFKFQEVGETAWIGEIRNACRKGGKSQGNIWHKNSHRWLKYITEFLMGYDIVDCTAQGFNRHLHIRLFFLSKKS